MAASFPNAKKTFSQLVDGSTYMEGVNVNTAYDEVEAIETMLGAMGSTQAYTDSYKNFLSSYRRGCAVEYKTAADLYVRAGEIAIPDASGNLRFRRNTSDTTVDWTDIDTGAEANSTLYYVYAVADASGTTFTVLISTNATTPTGATFYKRLGSFYNNASGDINQGSLKDDLPVSPSFWKHSGVEIYNAAAPSAWTDLDLSSVVGANRALVFLRVKPSGGAITIDFRTNGDDTEEIGSGDVDRSGTVEGYVGDGLVGYFLVETDAAGVIEWDTGGTVTTSIKIQGFIK